MSGKGMALYVVGGACALIGLFWGTVIGYYPHEAPFVIGLLIIGAVLMFFASRIEAANKPTKVEWRPTAPPTTVSAPVPAVPTPSAVDTGASYPVAPSQDVDDTVAVPRRRKSVSWSARLSDGSTVTIAQAALLGRAPLPSAEHPNAELIVVDDVSVSKNHAAVRVVDGALQIQDLQSANGTVMLTDDREQPCPPGVWLSVSDGATIELGTAALRFSSSTTRAVTS